MHGADEIPRVAPISLGFQVSKEKFGRQAKFDTRHAVGDFPGDELEAASRTLVVEQNAVGAGDAIGFAVVQGEVETRYLTDTIGTSRMERGGFTLWSLPDLAEHFTRSGEIETALRLHLPQSRQNIVGPVDVGAHGGEAVGEAFAHKALSAQVIAFVKLLLSEDVKDAGVALQAGRMEMDAVQTAFQT